MLPASLHDFMVANIGASASFIGLLFVALTVVLQRSDSPESMTKKDKVLAEGSYTALITIFFISLVSLIPQGRVDWVLLIMGLVGLASSAKIFISSKNLKRSDVVDTFRYGSVFVYAFITIYGFLLINNQVSMVNLDPFYAIIFTLYIVALGRAWLLIGLGDR